MIFSSKKYFKLFYFSFFFLFYFSNSVHLQVVKAIVPFAWAIILLPGTEVDSKELTMQTFFRQPRVRCDFIRGERQKFEMG